MIYRTAQRATYRNLNQNLGTLSYRIAQLTNQIASERRINTPSDDPSGAATVLATRGSLSSIAQYSTNIAVSDQWLTTSGNALQSIKETLDELYVKAEQGATDTYSAEQRKIIADEVNLLFQSLIQYSDAKIGDSYIFSGQKITTQPFGLKVEAQKVVAGCQNSDKWTGKVVNYGDPTFNNRPDLPIQSQDFLIEVVQAGGVDSRWYANTSSISTAKINGADYGFKFAAANPKYNNTQIKFVAGPANATSTGTAAADNGITFSGGSSSANVVYIYGTSAGTTAAWDSTTNTMVVSLRTDGGNPPVSVASAVNVIAAINSAAPPDPGGLTASAAAGSTGNGLVQTGKISLNYNETTVTVDGDQITVYLAQDNDGKLIATASSVASALNAAVGFGSGDHRLDITMTGSAATVSPTPVSTALEPGQPYTLAQTTVDPKGTQNALVWSVKNNSAFIGAAGNRLSVAYVVDKPFNNSAGVSYNSAANEITVHLAVSAAIYDKIFVQVYNDPTSGAFKDATKAAELATTAAIQTTANDIISLAAKHDDLKDIVDVSLADGNSGEGKVNVTSRSNFTEGYDQPALFRVSQDGGKTWGPPMSFGASEYLTGDMFHNAYLGHASMTTGFPGKANDLVFTAKQMGTWGNDVRVEYNLSPTATSATTVTVGPNPWNICVNLAVNSAGTVLTTANDVMSAINNHPAASQLVTADLANYHEGGNGIVKPMDCTALTVAEPYQVDGKSVITPLGHATANVSFDYSATAQKCPNIIFQAVEQGPEGNDIGVRYTTSADPTFYPSSAAANESYQDITTVRYEKVSGKTVMVVHLATEPLSSCPDAEDNPDGYKSWIETYPVYSCTETRAVIATADGIVEAIIKKNAADPESAAIWPSLERWPSDGTAKVGPTDGTVWLTGGNDTDSAANHGVNLKFIPDGTALQVGDVFEVPVGWYRGDDKDIDINASSNVRNTMNITGDNVFGGNGRENNILDTIQRLLWALEKNDSELVGKELPQLKAAIEQITSLETQVGTRQIRNQFVQKNLEQAQYSAENLLSTVEDADFSKLITDLKNAQTVYEACLGATGLTSKVSLLNYI